MIPENATHQTIRDTLYHAECKSVTLDITRKEFEKMNSKGYWDSEPVYVYTEAEGWILFDWITFTIRYHLSKYMDKETGETINDITHIKRGYSNSITDKAEVLSTPVLSPFTLDRESIIAYTDKNIYALCGYGSDIVEFFHLPIAYDDTFKPDIY